MKNTGKQHHSFTGFWWDVGKGPASDRVLSDLMLTEVRVKVSGGKGNSLQVQHRHCARGSSVAAVRDAACARFAFQLRRLVHSEGTLKQITSNTDH